MFFALIHSPRLQSFCMLAVLRGVQLLWAALLVIIAQLLGAGLCHGADQPRLLPATSPTAELKVKSVQSVPLGKSGPQTARTPANRSGNPAPALVQKSSTAPGRTINVKKPTARHGQPIQPAFARSLASQIAQPGENVATPPPIPANPRRQVDLGIKPLDRISLNLTPSAGTLPRDPASAKFASAGEVDTRWQTDRQWLPWTYAWQAPVFAHQPTYFEEPNLERYGHTAGCWQPLLSGAHFFGTIPLLPYKMSLDHPHECIYTLGHGRPGNCNAWQPPSCYFDPKALVVEGGVVTGLIFLFP
ncbi:MAG: hypothetical protein SFX18_09875 [Pirellulales bacterium]|nr:hypothetical protein [Pirellulales bacterium]